ncbi:hypothetical protein SFC08_16825 [Lysinibacillus halotolerans]
MNISFATTENMNTFWGYVKTLLGFASPWVMLAVSILAVGMLITIVIIAWKNASKDKEEDDDDFEIKHY